MFFFSNEKVQNAEISIVQTSDADNSLTSNPVDVSLSFKSICSISTLQNN
jgi:hypothetical protein